MLSSPPRHLPSPRPWCEGCRTPASASLPNSFLSPTTCVCGARSRPSQGLGPPPLPETTLHSEQPWGWGRGAASREPICSPQALLHQKGMGQKRLSAGSFLSSVLCSARLWVSDLPFQSWGLGSSLPVAGKKGGRA